MASRLKLARAGAAVVGASVALLMTAVIPAGAEAATGTVKGDSEDGFNVNLGEKDFDDMSTSLIGFELADGTKLQMYCVQIDTPIDDQHDMVEQQWDSYPNPNSPFNDNRAKINWILHNGFPVVSTDGLTKLLAKQGYEATNGIDAKEAVTATQASIWHFSDNKNLDLENPFPPAKGLRDSEDDVAELYKYLTGAANVGIGEQPTPALAVSPTDLSGKAGDRIGPFTVTTTGEIDKLTSKLPDGVKVTDKDGAELTADQIDDGTELFLDVPAGTDAGDGTFEVTATAGVDTGRLFMSENFAEKPTQSLIVAKAEKSEIVARASVAWETGGAAPTTTTTTTTESTAPTTTTTQAAPAPQPKNTSGDLAETGASIFAPVVLGIVLLAAGVGSLLFIRHRRRA
jgi:TQXA domain-containing protein